MPKPIEAVRVMPRVPDRATPIVQRVYPILDQAREGLSSQRMDDQVFLKRMSCQRVRFVDESKATKMEDILELDPKVDDVPSGCSSTDADPSTEMESTQSRHEDFGFLQVDESEENFRGLGKE
ncbi:hypothetical protein L7F22_026279 [Adiantum nelumboides]|nr:hypothetical protein [Adiantum nelumboides]